MSTFADPQGNFKLLVLSPDSVSVWDVRECESVGELRHGTRESPSRVLDVEWAASDRAVLAHSDGCVRVTGLSLATSTSAVAEYRLERPARCLPLLPNKARANLQALLHHQPWRRGDGGEEGYSLEFTSEDGFSRPEELRMVNEQVGLLLSEEVRAALESEGLDTARRGLIVARYSKRRENP